MERVWDLYKSKRNIVNISSRKGAVKLSFLLGLVSFFLGRVVLFQFMNPLVIAFLAIFIGTKRIYILALSMALGVITRFEGLLMLKNLSALSLVLLGHMFITLLQLKPKGLTTLFISGFSTLFSGLLFAFLLDNGSFFYLMAFAGSVFAVTLTILMKEGTALLSGKYKENIIDNEGLISLIIVIGATVAGAADIYIGVFSLKYILSPLIVLIGAGHSGVSAAATCGVTLGLILTLAEPLNYPLIGILSVGGMAAGFLRNGGRLACIAGFLAGAFLSALYLDVSVINSYFIFSLGAAMALFMLLPANFSISVSSPAINQAADEADRIKKLVERRLSAVSIPFKNMSRTLDSHSEKKQSLNQNDLSNLIDDTVAKACFECSYKNSCWGKDFYKTYQMSFNILEDYENGKEPDLEALDQAGPCKYIGYYSGWLSRSYDIYKLNMNWQNQIAESRQLVAEQLLSVSEIIDGLTGEIKERETLKDYLSEKIVTQFAKKNIEVRDVIVLENAYGKFSVSLERKSCLGALNCFREASAIVSGCIGRRMSIDKKACKMMGTSLSNCSLSFVQEPRFNIISGAAYAKKDGSPHSGDCHSVMEIKANQIILALSDGMGSGQKAKAESEAAMGLLEDFLEAGFSRELALKLINSVLVLKDGSEYSSTMDICAIDLHTGAAEFVKVGAAATFVKRGGSVAQIVSESLPMGILNEIDAEVCKKTVKNGDIIIMVTDGVYDSGNAERATEIGRNWVALALEEFDSRDPEDIADYLIGLAIRREDGQVKDDMTVLCARVWERGC